MRQIKYTIYMGGSGLDRTNDFQKFCRSGLDRIRFCRVRTGLGLKNFTVRLSLVNTRAVSMWLQLAPLRRGRRGEPAETLQALGCHLAVLVLSYCQQRFEAVICQSLPTKPGRSACGGNLHTPSDRVAAAIMQKRCRPWAVT